MSKIKKKYRSFVFPQRNRIFLSLSGLLLIMSVLIMKYCDFPLLLPEKYFGFLLCEPNTDKLWYNIGISYVAAYFFYIIQVYIPTYIEEKQSFKDIHRQLSGVIRSFKRIHYILFNMYDLGEHGELLIRESSFFFKEKYLDSYMQSSDYTDNKKTINNKFVRKGIGGCKTEAEFQNKLSEGKRIYENLMSQKSLDRIDHNLYDLVLQLDLVNYYEAISKVIWVMSRMQKVDQIVIEEKDLEQIEIPLYTNVGIDNENLIDTVKKIEMVCNIDSDVEFEEMTDEEIKNFVDGTLQKRIHRVFYNEELNNE